MKKIKKIVPYSILLLVPSITSAFSLFDAGVNFKSVIDEILSVISLLIPILFAMAFVVFFWGLSKFILHSDSKADIEKGRNYMLWGIVALFILVSFRAIINFFTLDLGFDGATTVPQLPTAYTGGKVLTTGSN